MNKFNVGELRHRITFQKQINIAENQYEDILSVWAAIIPISGREIFAAEMVQSEISHRIKMRYVKGITPDMRIAFGSRYFAIQSIINYEERNIELHLMCRELL